MSSPRDQGPRLPRGLLLTAVLACLAPSPARAWPTACKATPLAEGSAEALGADPTLGADLDALLKDAVESGETPGAALLVLRRGKVLFRGAAGEARLDSIFDLASLTKVVSTTPIIMRLVDRGLLSLGAPASRYTPLLAGPDKAAITLEQLLLHLSGLPSVVSAGRERPARPDPAAVFAQIPRIRLENPPGTAFSYSDTGFIVLGELLSRRTGKPLDRLVEEELLVPLGMCDTGFRPPEAVASRLVSAWPASKEAQGSRAGQPYDPLAARLGGVAGHAGLFSTVDDLGRYGLMLLGGGALGPIRVLSSESHARMLRSYPLPGRRGARSLGWDRSSPHASCRGALSAEAAFGHTGYTGTSLWVDPSRALVVVLLTNRTRHEPARASTPLRRRIHNVIVQGLLEPPTEPILTGLDRVLAGDDESLQGHRLGLITNQAAVDRKGTWIGESLLSRKDMDLRVLFVPEHGLSARLDRPVSDGELRHGNRRIPVHSLFGPRRRPPPEALAGLDTLVFDVPTIGVRFYTYLATMGWAMEEAARAGLRFVVLDRPNPLGHTMEGPISDENRRTSTNYHPIPIRYGLTAGELARLYNSERRLGARLTVVPVHGWSRHQTFRHQGLPWRDPSPNIRSYRQALLYAGLGLLETTNLSVGRGTSAPFQLVGAPFIREEALLTRLRQRALPGVHFTTARFTPSTGRFKGTLCKGIRVVVTDETRCQPVLIGLAIAESLLHLHKTDWQTAALYRLINHPPTTAALLEGRALADITKSWIKPIQLFNKIATKYILYK